MNNVYIHPKANVDPLVTKPSNAPAIDQFAGTTLDVGAVGQSQGRGIGREGGVYGKSNPLIAREKAY